MFKLNSTKKISVLLMPLIIFASSLSLMGCDENGGILIPSGATDLTVSTKADDGAQDNPADVVIITEAKALITNIQYQRERDGRDQLHHPGPYAVNLNVAGSLAKIMTGYIVRDIYTKAKFRIHKPDATETIPDPEFREGTADNQRYSFIVKGTFNGVPFVYRSKQAMEVVIDLNKATNINLKEQNMTMVFNKTMWFKSGTVVLNPNTAANAPIIDANIKNSFVNAFQDDNKDGVPD
jgi:hypothetical protein